MERTASDTPASSPPAAAPADDDGGEARWKVNRCQCCRSKRIRVVQTWHVGDTTLRRVRCLDCGQVRRFSGEED